MTVLRILCGCITAAFFIAGLMMILDVRATDFIYKMLKHSRNNRRQTLREKLEILQGQAPKNFFKRELYSTQRLLREMGKEEKLRLVLALALVFAALGVAAAALLHNWFLAPVLVAVCGGAPFLYIKIQAGKYKKAVDTALESTISLITTSYLRNDSLLLAVEENLSYLHPAVQSYFQEFYVDATRVNANIVTCINNLKLKLNHPIFHEWCSGLMMCQNDASMKKSLLPIVRKFSDNRTIQTDLDAELYAPKRELGLMAVMTALIPFFLYIMNKEWGKVLFTSVQGKITLAIVAAVVLYLCIKTMFFTKPVQFRGGDED